MANQQTALTRFSKRTLRAGGPLLVAALCIPVFGATAHGAQPGTETVLYSFTGTSGSEPLGGVYLDKHGNLYGATYFGGTSNKGAVFEYAADGTESTLYSFTGGNDGGEPYYAGAIADKKGNVYGTAEIGGTANDGVVYEVAPDGTETVLWSFTGGNDGSYPAMTLIRDKAGDLFGTTEDGGANGDGTIFEIPAGGTLTTLHSFDNTDGSHALGPLVQDKAGNIYGTTFLGGADGYGTVFELAASGTFSSLYSFTNGSDGSYPFGGVIVDKKGNLFGTAEEGGANGKGVVFEIAAGGAESTLHAFAGGSDGEYPVSGLVLGKKNTLYGTTQNGGSSNDGTIFEIAKNGTESVLYNFTGGTGDGAYPTAQLTLDKKTGIFYGTAYQGGADSSGVIFAFTP